MKRAVLFFLFLLVQLLGINHLAMANVHTAPCVLTSHNTIVKTSRLISAAEKKNFLVTQTGNFSGEDATILSVDDDDERDDLVKKNTSLTRSIATFTHAFFSTFYRSNSTENFTCLKQPSFSGSCKYIVQRTLRL